MVNRILERLEEYKYSHLVEHDSESIEHCKEQEKSCEGSVCLLCIWDKAIEIVQEVAKDGGWIPCSERLPEESGEYYTYIYYDGHYMYSIDEIDCDGIIKKWDCSCDCRIIAWKPIVPYQKGE